MNAPARRPRAVVFAYHNVGARGLLTLLAHGVDVVQVVTHEDNPQENIWFARVADLARERGIPVVTPENPNTPEFRESLRALAPDFLFSFYYRQMLGPELLALLPRGAYNLHGSLLPRYRGRVPVNWAVLHGERETGVTLHEMVEKPDAGRIVGQERVPILPDDTAHEVFNKVTVAAEICLDRVLPALLAGTITPQPQNLAAGSYFGGRKPEDGRITWSQSARAVHNLVRAVAPPYPGAFTDVSLSGQNQRLIIARSLPEDNYPVADKPRLYGEGDRLYADCGQGRLRILAISLEGKDVPLATLVNQIGPSGVQLL